MGSWDSGAMENFSGYFDQSKALLYALLCLGMTMWQIEAHCADLYRSTSCYNNGCSEKAHCFISNTLAYIFIKFYFIQLAQDTLTTFTFSIASVQRQVAYGYCELRLKSKSSAF